MGMGGGGGGRHTLQSDINVTPLVDVCLVLLMSLMGVTPLVQKGMAVTLPVTDNHGK
jgi:biopolymer transport protein TolR